MRKHYSLSFTAVSCLVLPPGFVMHPQSLLQWLFPDGLWVSWQLLSPSLPPHLPPHLQHKPRCIPWNTRQTARTGLSSLSPSTLILSCIFVSRIIWGEQSGFLLSRRRDFCFKQNIIIAATTTYGLSFREAKTRNFNDRDYISRNEKRIRTTRVSNPSCGRRVQDHVEMRKEFVLQEKQFLWEGENRQMCSKRQGMMWMPRMTFSLGKLVSFEAKRRTVIRQDHLSSN